MVHGESKGKRGNLVKIVVAGIGYVGLSNAVLLAQHHSVMAYDVSQKKVDCLNQQESPLADEEINAFLKREKLDLSATMDPHLAFAKADYVVIATPTNYDDTLHSFDTSTVEAVIQMALALCPGAVIVIKSTVPVGYTNKMRKQYATDKILFSPEFLREGKALYDNLYPSRIVVGDKTEHGKQLAQLLKQGVHKQDVPILLTEASEAEAIKLFANMYLAMRIAFFNELDTYAEVKGMDSQAIINGMGYDPRIGHYYNNPSFGYGGYCLPKDTKQLVHNYENIPNNIMQAVVKANSTRKDFIAARIAGTNVQTVGIFRLVMKTKADNFRESSVLGVIRRLKEKQLKVLIYEPMLDTPTFLGCPVIQDLAEFKQQSDVIAANRYAIELEDVREKIYTRDLYGRD